MVDVFSILGGGDFASRKDEIYKREFWEGGDDDTPAKILLGETSVKKVKKGDERGEGGEREEGGKGKSGDIIRELMPETIKQECSLIAKGDDICSSANVVEILTKHFDATDSATKPVEVIEIAKKETGCPTEKCAIEKLSEEGIIPKKLAVKELSTNFKVEGPIDGSLLNNFNIDNTLKQWNHIFPTFFAYNFNMSNYDKYSFINGKVVEKPDTLATIDFNALHEKGFDCCACVINSDKYQGGGKHWMALFASWRKGEPPSVEFFNSSGNVPKEEWCRWMIKMKEQMEATLSGAQVKLVKVSRIRHQNSRTECGLYSLFYIWSRLNGVSYEYMLNTTIPDRFMYEFRLHLFAPGEGEKAIGVTGSNKFNWEEYQKKAKVLWEKY